MIYIKIYRDVVLLIFICSYDKMSVSKIKVKMVSRMNKILKTIFILVGLILVLWGIIFTIDYVKCSNFQEPIFVVAEKTADDDNTEVLYFEKAKATFYSFTEAPREIEF